jgi:amino acid transporter
MSGISAPQIEMRRELGLRDVVLLYVIAVVSLQWLSTSALLGPGSLLLWLLAVVAFFVPSGLAVMEMHSRYAGEGGLYVWVKEAFGDVPAFVTGWCYVVSNFVFFPTVLLFLTGTAIYVGGGASLGLKDNFAFHAGLSLVVVWVIVLANIVGLGRAKWLSNAGALLMGAVLVILVAVAFASASQFGSATTFSGALVPDIADPALVKSFSAMMLALVGLELAPLMGGEIREPRRVIPRAIALSALPIVAFYVLGTWALMVALPKDRIEAMSGVPEAVTTIAARLGMPALGPLTALLMALATAGILAAWLTGVVRLPYVVGVDRHLPPVLGRLHPQFQTPHVALFVCGVITSALVLLAMAGATVGEAYQVLVDTTVVLTFLPLVFLFAALPVLRAKRVGDPTLVLPVPGGWTGNVVVTALGLGSAVLAIVLALVPPAQGNTALFYLKVVGGSVLFIGIGFAFYRRR